MNAEKFIKLAAKIVGEGTVEEYLFQTKENRKPNTSKSRLH